MPVSVIDGVRIPDAAMVELLLAAKSQGFRMEAGTGGGHAEQTGFTLYPPDKAHGPIRAGCTEVNPRHVSNIRRSLMRAGFDPNPTEPAPEVPVSTRNRKSAIQMPSPADSLASLPPNKHASMEMIAGLSPAERVEFGMGVVKTLAEQIGLRPDTATLAGMFLATLEVFDRDRDGEVCSRAELDHANKEATAAMRLAEEAEEKARKATQRAEKAEKQGAETGRLLTEARAELVIVEADRDEMKRALDPLRALLGKTA